MQTAIEYLLEQMKDFDIKVEFPKVFNIIIDQALEMEREQILLAWENGSLPAFIKEHKCSRDYFTETYKKHGDETI